MKKLKGWIVPILILVISVFYDARIGSILLAVYILYMLYRSRSAVFSRLGSRSYGKGDFNKALLWYERALKDPMAQPNTILSCSLILLKMGEWDRAREVYERVEDNDSLSEYGQGARKTSEALITWKEGQPVKAIQQMETLLPLFQNSTLFASLGAVYLSTGKNKKALEHCTEAYEFNKNHAIIRDNYARSLCLNGQEEEAALIWDAMIKEQSAMTEPYYNRAALYFKEDEIERAKGFYKKSQEYTLSQISYLSTEEYKELGRKLNISME
jgi:tetratricopeptide (TPR) repeat protein